MRGTVLCSVVKHLGSGRALKRSGEKRSTASRVFPYTSSVLYPLPACFTTEQSTVYQQINSHNYFHKFLSVLVVGIWYYISTILLGWWFSFFSAPAWLTNFNSVCTNFYRPCHQAHPWSLFSEKHNTFMTFSLELWNENLMSFKSCDNLTFAVSSLFTLPSISSSAGVASQTHLIMLSYCMSLDKVR